MELALLSKVESDHAESVAWAREKLSSTEWLILDTETTGLSTITSRVVEIAVLDPLGKVLLETLVNPETEIPEGASRIHGISNLDVVDSPTMTEVWPELLATVENRLLLCYNVNYDKPLLANEAARRRARSAGARAAAGVGRGLRAGGAAAGAGRRPGGGGAQDRGGGARRPGQAAAGVAAGG